MIDILTTVGAPAVYEQLAEEAAELAQAALKCARILRNENPTPLKMDDCVGNLVEEATDVAVCLGELDIRTSPDIFKLKRDRWVKRIEEMLSRPTCTGDCCDISELLRGKETRNQESENHLMRDLTEEMFSRNHGG